MSMDAPLEIRSLAREILDANNKIKLLPASFYDQIPFYTIRLFCHYYARYGLPTLELVEWLKDKIKGLSAIEIGAGAGDLGYHLGIPMTDSYCQEIPEVKEFYQISRQPTIQYGKDVERLDALQAIDKYKPDVVIASWVTQWIDPDLPPPPGGGNVYGVKEEELLKRVGSYIVIGAEEIHRHKTIMKIPHKTFDLPFVRSRRKDNRIWIWEK